MLSLSRKFFEQLPSGAVVLDFAVVFVYVVAHGHQEDLGKYFFVTPEQELPKTVILLDDTEGALRLDGTVYPEQDALFAGDALKRLLTLLDKLF